jgi:ATP-binding cassette subfamily B protein
MERWPMAKQARHTKTKRNGEAPSLINRPGRGPGAHRGGEKAKDVWGTLIRLWRYLRRERRTLGGVAGLVILTTILNVTGPALMGIAIDRFITQGNLTGLARIALAMLVVTVLASLGTWLQQVIMVGVAQRVVRDLRQDLFDRLQTLSLSFFDRHPHGDLMSRLSNDVETISNVLTSNATQLISSALTIVGVIVAMFMINVPLAVVTLLVLPLMVVLTRGVTQRSRTGFRAQQKHLGELNGIIEETVTGQQVVKAFVREQEAIDEFDVANRKLQRAATRAEIFAGFMGPVMNLVNNVSLAVVAGAGGWMALRGWATVGTIAAFISYARQFGRPLSQVAQLFNVIQAALAGAERVFAVSDEEPGVTDAPDAQALDHIQGKVTFEDVRFSYEPGVPVLKHVTMYNNPGEMIALVGPTGAGKTTIINLLTRFYDVDSGAIRVDGVDIRDIRMDELRRKLGLVLQDNFLFADTVMENIRYGRLEATDEEVVQAAKLANAHSFIHRLPQGYRTELSERGGNLSLGQRQLLAIARAVLADPDILILDEATSNVDTRTEKKLQQALMRLMEGRTSFVIAHRLSTIRDADCVMVIKDGEVIERGTHEELLAKRGFYHRLYTSQFKGQMVAPALQPA